MAVTGLSSQNIETLQEQPFNLKFVNSTSTFNLGNEFSQEDLFKRFPQATASKSSKNRSFSFLKVRWNKFTSLIYPTGKVVIIGCRHIKEIKMIRKYITEILEITGRPKIKIRNIVATGNLGIELDLVALYDKLREKHDNFFGYYSPDIFNGLVYHATKDIRMIFFRTGSFIITGTNEYKDIVECLNKFLSI